MRVFGFEISRARRPSGSLSLSGAGSSGGWLPIVREPFTGAWQTNQEITAPSALANGAVFGCVTLIATDIGKLPLELVTQDADGVWTPTENPAFSPVLRTPNRYQTIIKFLEQWMLSKLTAGNTYVLKQRDDRNVVTALYILDPARVRPLIAPDGAVYYELDRNHLAGLVGDLEPGLPFVVPAREIIHDPMYTLFHPLVGVSPLYACGLAALQGLTIQEQSEIFFRMGSHPGGVITTPNKISDETAKRVKTYWETEFSGANVGRVAVMGDGLKYEAMTVSAHDAQLIEQLQWTAQQICSCFHVPPYMLDIGPSPTNANVEPLLQKYHSQCLQTLIASLEAALDQGLGLTTRINGTQYGTYLDIDDLIWMDTATKTKAAADAIGGGGMSPNEARSKWFGLGPVPGGATPYMQQQMFSLAALAERDADAPFSKAAPAPAATPATPALPAAPDDPALETAAFEGVLIKALGDLYARD